MRGARVRSVALGVHEAKQNRPQSPPAEQHHRDGVLVLKRCSVDGKRADKAGQRDELRNERLDGDRSLREIGAYGAVGANAQIGVVEHANGLADAARLAEDTRFIVFTAACHW